MPFSIRRYQDRDVYLMTAVKPSRVANFDRPWLNVQGNNSLSYTVTENEIPLACGGLVAMWPGVMCLWLAPSTDIDGKGLAVTKILKQLLYNVIMVFNVKTVIAYVYMKDRQYLRWARLFGFKLIGVMAHAADDDTDVGIIQLTLGE